LTLIVSSLVFDMHSRLLYATGADWILQRMSFKQSL